MSFTSNSKRSSSPADVYNSTPKRMKLADSGKVFSGFSSFKSLDSKSKYMREKTLPDIFDYSDPSSVQKLVEGYSPGEFGSLGKQMENVYASKAKLLSDLKAITFSLPMSLLKSSPQTAKEDTCDIKTITSSLPISHLKSSPQSVKEDTPGLVNRQEGPFASHDVVDLDDDCVLLEVYPTKDSASVNNSFVGDIQACGCDDGGISIGHAKTPTSVEKGIVVIDIDSDEEDNDCGQIGSFEVSQGLVTQSPIKLEMERGQDLSSPTNNLFHEIKLKRVDDDKMKVKVVQSKTMCDVTKQQSSYSYQEVLLKKSIDENQSVGILVSVLCISNSDAFILYGTANNIESLQVRTQMAHKSKSEAISKRMSPDQEPKPENNSNAQSSDLENCTSSVAKPNVRCDINCRIKWDRPPVGTYEVNTDGSLKTVANPDAISVMIGSYEAVLKDDVGLTISASHGQVLGSNILHHELQGVSASLQLAINARVDTVCIRSDSMEAVNISKAKVPIPWRDKRLSSHKLTTVSREKQKTDEDKKAANKGVYVGVEDDLHDNKSGQDDDGCNDLWNAMDLALESYKEDAMERSVVEYSEREECDHSFVLKDDLGYVCRVCGVISKSIDTIFDYQWIKGSKSTRTYMSTKDRDQIKAGPFSLPNNAEQDLALTEISVHPRHMQQMKQHQLQGFNFLVKNLVSDKPSGCVLAHAPGSGKTFMVFSFIQSFLAKYPSGRPLVILPKSILSSWKKEIKKWQVEDIPLYDFYSSKADKRSQQLDVLKKWVDHKGILFLGYKQFSSIVGSVNRDRHGVAEACHDILIKVPTILILDEGHTPRNDETDMASSLSKVQTPRKVVLSGTLFQNHVKEVFNILNLVRPTFGRSDTVRAIVRRIISRVQIRVGRRPPKAELDAIFYELVEETLRKEEDLRQKFPVIQDLRELTKEILHYYKGDFLDELPGLVDLSVHLNLSAKQKPFVKILEKMDKFRSGSIGSALYMHPELRDATTVASEKGEKRCKVNEDKIEDLLEKINYNDGVKIKFFLNMVRFCESSGEKLIVFGTYLPPLKFLEKLVIKTRGWSVGKQIFLISGDTSAEQREYSMDGFNNNPDAKVFFGSIKACGEGISLVGGSRVLLLDVHLNPSVTRQAIARAFRPGQLKKVYAYRLVAAGSPEEEDDNTSFRKELISKMWFEWNMYCFPQNLEMEPVDVTDCDDPFWEFSALGEDVKVLYKRTRIYKQMKKRRQELSKGKLS
ncbi:hypothetical protein GIB67_001395 [Kingdonia uniflora]|uniref:Uncharacterized protein n=1 Tax=Kingdonia uniflora TaxID=39325 RepID=A0A7J7N7G0_9MAGN|nr:hypothetical protein GIB67_001395 [Kingdonia uniflora]